MNTVVNTNSMSHSSSSVSPTVYSINAFYEGTFMFQTDFSNSKERAKQLLHDCTTMDLSKLEFQMYRSTPKGPIMVNSSYNGELYDMTLEKWKGGLLLRPMDDDERWGEKYFMGGWWMPQQESWFFKMEEFDNLVNKGAEYISDVILVDEDETDDETDDEMPELVGYDSDYNPEDEMSEQTDSSGSHDELDEMVDLTSLDIEAYGKGYLVRAPKDHKDYGKKYYGSGWWNSEQNGWFFKKEHYDEIVRYGAVEYKPDVIEWVEPYGKGYLLKPLQTHPHYGNKYYRNGWWNPLSKGWFFKTEFVDEETMTVM